MNYKAANKRKVSSSRGGRRAEGGKSGASALTKEHEVGQEEPDGGGKNAVRKDANGSE